MENVGVDQHLATWTTDYLTNRPQFVRLHHYVSDVILCSTGAPQSTVLSPFLFTLYTSDFTHNTTHCHIQKFYRRKTSHFTPVNIQGSDIEVVKSYKFLGVHLNNKLDWTDNTNALFKNGPPRAAQGHRHRRT